MPEWIGDIPTPIDEPIVDISFSGEDEYCALPVLHAVNRPESLRQEAAIDILRLLSKDPKISPSEIIDEFPKHYRYGPTSLLRTRHQALLAAQQDKLLALNMAGEAANNSGETVISLAAIDRKFHVITGNIMDRLEATQSDDQAIRLTDTVVKTIKEHATFLGVPMTPISAIHKHDHNTVNLNAGSAYQDFEPSKISSHVGSDDDLAIIEADVSEEPEE